MSYEYGVTHISDTFESEVRGYYKGGMSEDQADDWIKEWEEGGGKKGAFVKIRRPIGEWEVVK